MELTDADSNRNVAIITRSIHISPQQQCVSAEEPFRLSKQNQWRQHHRQKKKEHRSIHFL